LPKGNPIVLDYYYNESKPVANAQEQINIFRRLKTIGDYGIVRGGIWDLDYSFTIPNARVVARRVANDMSFVTTSGADGRYEFPPLSAGKYTLTVDPIGSRRYAEYQVNVSSGSCSEISPGLDTEFERSHAATKR
jgi:hypothetical protein